MEEGFVPEVFDPAALDGRYLVSNVDAIAMVRRLADEEGVLGGVSSGAALAVALRVAAELERGTIVVLLADGGWKYLSDELWTRDLGELSSDAEARNWW